MRHVETIVTLAKRAATRAEKSGKNGIATIKRHGLEVYRIQYEKGGLAGDTVVLYHYGTPTAEVWLTHPNASILSVYGESASDAASVTTFLRHYGINKYYTFKPVNGGFQEAK